MCIQAVLDGAGALRHMNKINSERPVDVCSPLLCLFPTRFRAKKTFRAKKEKNTYCVVTVTPPSLQGLYA